jgi:hypothetical protein
MWRFAPESKVPSAQAFRSCSGRGSAPEVTGPGPLLAGAALTDLLLAGALCNDTTLVYDE